MPRGARFEFDSRQLKKAVDRVARDAVRDAVEDVQRVFDDVYRTHHGEPVDQVKAKLRRAWQRQGQGWDISDRELTDYATAISQGQRVSKRVKAG